MVPGVHTRPRSLRGEVDDHDVLGVVLGAAAKPRRRCRRSLDRAGLDVGAAPAQEELGRGGDHCHLLAVDVEAQQRGVRRGVVRRERAEEVDGIQRVIERESAREVHLIALARAQQLEDLVHARRVLLAIQRRMPRGIGPRRGRGPRHGAR